MEESDMKAYPELMWDAFKDDLMALLYPNGYPQSAREHTTKKGLEGLHKDPEVHKWMKVIDTDLPKDDHYNQLVGMAHWEFHLKERTEAELDAEAAEKAKEEPDAAIDRGFADKFFADIGRIRRETMGGKPYILLHLLATHPDHHRRGVGAMHLNWGAQKADEFGLPMMLEASPIGRPLYEKNGYVKVGDLPVDAMAHGHPKELPHAIMIRPAKGAAKN